MIKVQLCNVVQECDARMMSNEQKARTKKIFAYLFIYIYCFLLLHKYPDAVYKANIKAVRFHIYGDQQIIAGLQYQQRRSVGT